MGLQPGSVENVVGPSRQFWAGRRVLITGHTGFKGAWLWLLLESLGAEVSGIALPPHTNPSLFELAGLANAVRSQFVDIRYEEAVRDSIMAAEPEVVFHMAAQALVLRSYSEPVATFAVNVLGTAHVLNAVRSTHSVRAGIIVTSDKCYRNRETPDGYSETDELGGHDPYSASKACAELVVESWRRSFFASAGLECGIASARGGNAIGGGDWAQDRLIPDCARAFSAGQAVEVRNPSAVRPWQHVLDLLTGYLVLAERLDADPKRYSEAWNFGPSGALDTSVADLVAYFAERWGSGADWGIASGDCPPEAPALRIDASKANRQLGWQCRLDVKSALDWTADWYVRFAGGEDPRKLCLEQIARFAALGS
jgi:CDP-glucose 4,6-dehydratase